MNKIIKISVIALIFFIIIASSSILAHGDTCKVSNASVRITPKYVQNHNNIHKINHYNVRNISQQSNDSQINQYMSKHHDAIAGSSISFISLLILGINSFLKKHFRI